MKNKKHAKVKWNDFFLVRQYLSRLGVLSTLITIFSFCINIVIPAKIIVPLFVIGLIAMYIFMWYKANNLREVRLRINQTNIKICIGDIFNIKEDEINIIPTNEFFDTFIDNRSKCNFAPYVIKKIKY